MSRKKDAHIFFFKEIIPTLLERFLCLSSEENILGSQPEDGSNNLSITLMVSRTSTQDLQPKKAIIHILPKEEILFLILYHGAAEWWLTWKGVSEGYPFQDANPPENTSVNPGGGFHGDHRPNGCLWTSRTQADINGTWDFLFRKIASTSKYLSLQSVSKVFTKLMAPQWLTFTYRVSLSKWWSSHTHNIEDTGRAVSSLRLSGKTTISTQHFLMSDVTFSRSDIYWRIMATDGSFSVWGASLKACVHRVTSHRWICVTLPTGGVLKAARHFQSYHQNHHILISSDNT